MHNLNCTKMFIEENKSNSIVQNSVLSSFAEEFLLLNICCHYNCLFLNTQARNVMLSFLSSNSTEPHSKPLVASLIRKFNFGRFGTIHLPLWDHTGSQKFHRTTGKRGKPQFFSHV